VLKKCDALNGVQAFFVSLVFDNTLPQKKLHSSQFTPSVTRGPCFPSSLLLSHGVLAFSRFSVPSHSTCDTPCTRNHPPPKKYKCIPKSVFYQYTLGQLSCLLLDLSPFQLECLPTLGWIPNAQLASELTYRLLPSVLPIYRDQRLGC